MNIQNTLNQAVNLHQAGKVQDAISLYLRILPKQEENAQLLYLLGTAFLQCGQLNKGIDCLRKSIVLNPQNSSAHNNIGTALKDLKQLEEALTSYDKAIELKSDYAEAYYNRGTALQVLKRLEEALTSYDKAIALIPGYVEAYYNRGTVLQELKRLDEALASYDKAIVLKLDHAGAYNNRGAALQALKRLEEALTSYDKAIALIPGYVEAYYNRGTVLQELKRLDEALASYDKAIALAPDYAKAYCNRGTVLQVLKRLDEALDSHDKAIVLAPDYAKAHWNKGLLHILSGRYQDGWALYEWRLQMDDTSKNYYKFASPKHSWRGQESVEGKRIFIHSEQGFGDVIQFCRYLPLVKSQGCEVILEVPKPMVAFVSTLNCEMTVIGKGDAHPEFDAYCPIMSLPYVFKTTVETIPANTPYLYANRDKVENWLQKLGPKDRFRVGLVWSGSTAHENDINRSIPLETMLPLFDMPIELHSLQKEYRKDDLTLLQEHPEIHQHQDELEDFSDTAALTECMDLVISVDTSAAHIAGSLGKPVWILLPYVPDYRWMLDREDSPWYPTAKLYRQTQFDDWPSVIETVRKSLTVLMEPRRH